MALGTDHFSGISGDLDVFMPLVWGEKINDFLRPALKVTSKFTDLSSDLVGGADSITIPNLTEMSSNAKTVGSQVTLSSPTETALTLTVDTHKEVSFIIEDKLAAQVKQSYNLQERYAINAAHTVAKDLEKAVIALFAGFSNSVGASTSVIADSNIRAAIAQLEANNVPVYDGNAYFFFHPTVLWSQVMGLNAFQSNQYSTDNDTVNRGVVGKLYGIEVVSTPLIEYVSSTTGRVNALAHKDAIVYATHGLKGGMNSYTGEMGVRVQANYVPEYLGTLVTADICYGVAENRDIAGVRILTAATGSN